MDNRMLKKYGQNGYKIRPGAENMTTTTVLKSIIHTLGEKVYCKNVLISFT